MFALAALAVIVVAVAAIALATVTSSPKPSGTKSTTTTSIGTAGVNLTVPTTTAVTSPTTTAPAAVSSSGASSTTSSTTTSSTTSTNAPTTSSPAVTIPADQVVVEVLNGSGAPGEATMVGSALTSAGFALNGTGNASSFGYTTSEIQYPPGHLAAATTLLDHLDGPTMLDVDSELEGDNVVLIVGSTFREVVS